MNNLTSVVVVDSDVLIALFNKNDTNFSKVEKLFKFFYEQKVRIIYPSTTLVETVDTLQRRLKKHHEAAQVVKLITEAKFARESIEAVDGDYLKEAAKIFQSGISNRTTLADAVVAAVARKNKADAIFSFDDWYSKLGFTLAVNLFK